LACSFWYVVAPSLRRCPVSSHRATTQLPPLSLHDALPISPQAKAGPAASRDRHHQGDLSAQKVCRSRALKQCVPERKLFGTIPRSEEHTSELQSRFDLVCRLLLEKKK